MKSLILLPASRHVFISYSSVFCSDFYVPSTIEKRAIYFPASCPQILHCNGLRHPQTTPRSYIRYGPPYGEEDDDPEVQVESLRVPDDWSVPSKALEESEWLRTTLHKWLDDEYCPEETNVEISKVAANSYYKSLLEKRTDLGDILLKMARELESISYKESFHALLYISYISGQTIHALVLFLNVKANYYDQVWMFQTPDTAPFLLPRHSRLTPRIAFKLVA